jgi:predicted metal-binding protein
MENGLRSDDAIATFDAPPAGGHAPAASEAEAPAPVAGVTVVVCHSCRRETDSMDYPRPGSRLHAAVKDTAAGTGIAVRKIGCLGNCKRGISAAILRDGSWSYVFGELTEDSAADLIAGATLFAGSTDGFMPFRARPEALKRGLIARIPLIDHVKDAE